MPCDCSSNSSRVRVVYKAKKGYEEGGGCRLVTTGSGFGSAASVTMSSSHFGATSVQLNGRI